MLNFEYGADIETVSNVSEFLGNTLNIAYSERRLIGHSFYRRNFLRKSCATCREKCRRTAPRTEKSDKPAQ
jgi:hypothetical protein